jgi:hypothetical protein
VGQHGSVSGSLLLDLDGLEVIRAEAVRAGDRPDQPAVPVH